jgi:predicted ATPase/DNA-binding CsgD family transcriptional regulator
MLPPPRQTLIGRERELDELGTMLRQPNCRLLTITGAGGSGKTSLALQLARELGADFADGGRIVLLQAISSSDQLAQAIADSLNLAPSSGDSADDHLLRTLAHHQLLLVLDNYEHLLPDVSLIIRLLDETTNLRLLITSREMLKLRDEWVYSLGGLAYPNDTQTTAAAQGYSAVQLFSQFMQHARRDHIDESDFPAIVRICRAVEGMPLGLELAASWTRTLTPSVIAAEIEHNLDFLATSLRDFPARHRSMRAVFDQSWQHLDEQERMVFRRLSVFRGGFDRAAAEFIAGASLHVLSSLVEKSLLSVNGTRYYLHELLRQYATEYLVAADELMAVRAAHARYYAGWLHDCQPLLSSDKQRDIVYAIRRDLDNVRATWNWAVEQGDYQLLHRAILALDRFYDTQGRYREAADAYQAAIARLLPYADERDCARALALIASILGWTNIRLGRYEESQAAFLHSRQLLTHVELQPDLGLGSDPLSGLAMLKVLSSEYDEARELANNALLGAKTRSDWANIKISHHVIASAAYAQGDYESTALHAAQLRAIAERVGDQWMVATALMHFGNVAHIQGDIAQARRYYTDGHEICKAFDDPEGMASFLYHDGLLELTEGDHRKAQRRFADSLALYKDLGDRGGLASVYIGLGDALLGQGDLPTAREYILRALDILIETGWTQTLLLALASATALLARMGESSMAAHICDYLSQQNLDPQTRRRVEQVRASITQPPAALPDDLPNNLILFARAVQTILREKSVTTAPTSTAPTVIHADALSERELEILRLLADGYSNSDIAEKLILALGTVKAHNHNIFSKLGVDSRVRAISRARELGLL